MPKISIWFPDEYMELMDQLKKELGISASKLLVNAFEESVILGLERREFSEKLKRIAEEARVNKKIFMSNKRKKLIMSVLIYGKENLSNSIEKILKSDLPDELKDKLITDMTEELEENTNALEKIVKKKKTTNLAETINSALKRGGS